MASERFDVIMIGAGLSGIGAARYLRTRLPNKSFTILETKPRMGGTWDLFRYPGIRSDSDMHTMGYAFKPWKHPKAISEGGAIIDYIEETAAENDIARHIRYQHKVITASWSSKDTLWTLQVEKADGSRVTLQAPFIFSCAGYYNHHAGYLPEWPGYHDFKGTLVHPQFWPEDLDYAGKRVVIVGSGATAVTLGPSLAKTAAHVTQLQRSADLRGEPSVRRYVQHGPEAVPAGAACLSGDALAHDHRRPVAGKTLHEGPEGHEADAGGSGREAGRPRLRSKTLHAGLLAGPATHLPRAGRRHVRFRSASANSRSSPTRSNVLMPPAFS